MVNKKNSEIFIVGIHTNMLDDCSEKYYYDKDKALKAFFEEVITSETCINDLINEGRNKETMEIDYDISYGFPKSLSYFNGDITITVFIRKDKIQ